MAFEYKEFGNDPNLFWRVCIFILGIELAERLCYYTFAGSQEYFLEDLNYSVLQSSGVNAAFATLCYVWPLVGGYLADARWGRFRTIFDLRGLLYAGSPHQFHCGAAWRGTKWCVVHDWHHGFPCTRHRRHKTQYRELRCRPVRCFDSRRTSGPGVSGITNLAGRCGVWCVVSDTPLVTSV